MHSIGKIDRVFQLIGTPVKHGTTAHGRRRHVLLVAFITYLSKLTAQQAAYVDDVALEQLMDHFIIEAGLSDFIR